MDSSTPESTRLVQSGKSLLTHFTETVSTRARLILPHLIRSSVLITLASIFTLFSIGWLSVLVWEQLRLSPLGEAYASAVLGGGFLAVAAICFLVGRRSGAAALETPHGDQKPEDEASVRSELAAFSADVGRVAKQALDPMQVLEANAGKVILVSTLIGVIVGMQASDSRRRKK